MKTAASAVLAAIASGLAGWCLSGALVLPRVDAIERSLSRIEQRLDAMTSSKVAQK